jgi:heat shock protein HtpX
VWTSPQKTPNACAIGFTATDSHVVFTEGITQLLSQTELRAVAGHEVAHIARADSVRNTALAAEALGIVAAGAAIGAAVELGFLLDGNPGNDLAGMLIGMGIQALATGAAASKLSRELKQAEFAADAHGAALLKCHGDMSRGLARMQQAQRTDGWSGIPMAETSHMFIVPTGFSFAVSNVQTHPATGDRQFALTVIQEYGG